MRIIIIIIKITKNFFFRINNINDDKNSRINGEEK